MPRPGPGETVRARPCRCAIAVVHHGRTTARITRCRRREYWRTRTLNSPIGTRIAYLWRCAVQGRYGLMHWRAGVAAGIHRMVGIRRSLTAGIETSVR